MRVFHVDGDHFAELPALPASIPATGYLWVGVARPEFRAQVGELQEALQRWSGGQLVDLHVSDMANDQLPSHFDYTSWYDLLVFRRLALASLSAEEANAKNAGAPASLQAIDTQPVAFAVFDRVLLTVHPKDCQVRDYFADRLRQQGAASDLRGSARMPPSAADLMLRMVNHIVDGYLELRRVLTRQNGQLQQQLLEASDAFHGWKALLESRNRLHLLDEICEDQRAAVIEWIDSLDEWPAEEAAPARRERELLRVRSRDVLEHIERVLAHVRRLESSAETAVQIHFAEQGNRTNSIMRTLTVLTAIFLPLNLVSGFFGLNFEGLPLIHSVIGFWVALGLMLALGIGLSVFFWRKRYLGGIRH